MKPRFGKVISDAVASAVAAIPTTKSATPPPGTPAYSIQPSEARASMLPGVDAYVQPKASAPRGSGRFNKDGLWVDDATYWKSPEGQEKQAENLRIGAAKMAGEDTFAQGEATLAEQRKQGTFRTEAVQAAQANTPEWQAALEAYNSGKAVPEKFRGYIENLQSYFQEGQADPGNLTNELVQSAEARWTQDARPSTLDRVVDVAVPVLIGGAALAALAGVGAGAVTSGGGGLGTTAMPLQAVEGYTAGTTAGMPLTAVEGYTAGTTVAPSLTSTIVDGAVEGALKGAARGALTSALTGGDPLEGAKRGLLGGAVGGGVGATIGNVMPSVAIEGHPDITAAIDSGVKGALTQGSVAAVTGGNVGDAMLSGGLIGAVAPSIEKVLPKDENTYLNPTVTGAIGGGIDAGVTGGSVVNGIVTGALGGLGSAVGGEYGGTVGAITGGVLGNVIGNEIAPVHTPSNPAVMPSKYVPGTMSKMSSIVKDQPKNLGNYESLAVTRAKQRRS